MVESWRKGEVWLSYDHLITKILEYFGFDLEEEKPMENAITIGSHYQWKMPYDHHNKVLVQRGIKEWGGTQSQ